MDTSRQKSSAYPVLCRPHTREGPASRARASVPSVGCTMLAIMSSRPNKPCNLSWAPARAASIWGGVHVFVCHNSKSELTSDGQEFTLPLSKATSDRLATRRGESECHSLEWCPAHVRSLKQHGGHCRTTLHVLHAASGECGIGNYMRGAASPIG